MSTQRTVPAVQRSVTVNAPIDKAFSVFTDHFTTWWPKSHQINPNGYEAAYIEPRLGGRWFERAPDGSECDWGQVLAWEPPNRVLLSWHLTSEYAYDADPVHASEVEVTFVALGPSTTRVDLHHSKFERAIDGEKIAEGVSDEGGWGTLLGRFADLVEGRELKPLG